MKHIWADDKHGNPRVEEGFSETAQSCLDWAAGDRSDSKFMASGDDARQAEVSPKVDERGSHTMQRTGRQEPIPQVSREVARPWWQPTGNQQTANYMQHAPKGKQGRSRPVSSAVGTFTLIRCRSGSCLNDFPPYTIGHHLVEVCWPMGSKTGIPSVSGESQAVTNTLNDNRSGATG